jgi:hypothetical protein
MLLLLEDNDDSRRAMGKYLDAWQYPEAALGSGFTALCFPTLPMTACLKP